MKAFGTWVRGEVERQKCSNKDVIGRIFDGLVPNSDSLSTVQTKFSKLLNGDPEGDRYFMEPERRDRLTSLAKAINRTEDEVLAARTRCNSARTLILDPRLRADVVTLLLEISRGPEAGLSCVQVPPDSGDLRHALRDAADGAENAIVVVANSDDIGVFALAKIESSLVEVVPRGLRLRSYPDLIPVPPPSPPRAFDDDGRVLVPLAIPVIDQLRYRDAQEDYDRLIAPAVKREEVPCLSLRDAITWLTRRGGPLHSESSRRIEWVEVPALTTKHLLGEKDCETQVWEDGRAVFAVGPRKGDLAALLQPHHEVLEAPLLRMWADEIRNANPWRLPKSAEAPSHALHSVHAALAEWARSAGPAMLTELRTASSSTGRLSLPPDPGESRETLREISRRDIEREVASSAFVLARAVEASWIVFGADDGNLDVLADMGGGSLVSIRARRVNGAPSGVRLLERGDSYGDRRHTYQALECGDYVLVLRADSDVRLEGPLLGARARRRAASDDAGSYDEE